METATPGVKSTADGWLNRYLQARKAEDGESVPRGRADAAAAAHAAGHAPALAMSQIAQFGIRGAEHERVVRSAVRSGGRSAC